MNIYDIEDLIKMSSPIPGMEIRVVLPDAVKDLIKSDSLRLVSTRLKYGCSYRFADNPKAMIYFSTHKLDSHPYIRGGIVFGDSYKLMSSRVLCGDINAVRDPLYILSQRKIDYLKLLLKG